MNRIVSALMLTPLFVLSSCTKTEAPPVAVVAAPQAPIPEVRPDPTEPVNETTERLFQNPYDTDAVYFLSQKNGTPEALSVLVKRVSQHGTEYSRWLFNCNDSTAQNLGVAANVQALDRAENSMPSKSQPFEAASKLGAIAAAVCR
jgi:hypothetical protein